MAQSINIKIAGRPYNLTATSPEHEEVIRKAAEEVNAKIAQYQEKFPNKGLTEILSFMALKGESDEDVGLYPVGTGCVEQPARAGG